MRTGEFAMRVHRLLIPLVAVATVAGLCVALVAVLRTPASPPPPNALVTEVLALKGQAEALAIDQRLEAAHAKYRELFDRVAGREREIKDPAFWDLVERAKIDQDMVYRILLAKRDPARVLTPGTPTTTTQGATAPATTPSFVEVYPPYSGVSTAPTTVAVTRPAVTTTTRATEVPPPRRLTVVRTPRDAAGFSDAAVGDSLNRANEFLMAQFQDGQVAQGKEYSETYRQGLNALCVYALLHGGQATRDPRLAVTSDFMRRAIEQVKLHPMATDTTKAQQPVVYARSLRAAVLAEANRPEDRAVLKDDVAWLLDAGVDGTHTYDDRFTVRVVKGDLRGAGRNVVKPKPEPVDPNAPKPKTLGAPREEQPVAPKAPRGPTGVGFDDAPAPGGIRGGALVAGLPALCPGLIVVDDDGSGRDVPDAFADGLHDPKTGMELGPRLGPYPRPVPPPYYPPQQLPEKYDGPFVWDNSNTQFALMGIAAGADAGVEVPDAYWAAAQKHWLGSQLASGEWGYRKDTPQARPALTFAGAASLLATHDFLEAPAVARVGHQASPIDAAMARAMAWVAKGDNAVDVGGGRTVYLGYTLHALSRLGLASGQKHFGAHDWYREMARKVVLSQWENGAWGRTEQASADTLVDTAFTALFLARGRHPVVMNKLRLAAGEGDWDNRPRDLAGLCRFASRELERPVNWQTVSLDHAAADWADAPILYFASHVAVKFTDADVAKIRAFAVAGGMIFTQSDGNSESFNLFVNQLAKRAFPEWELKELSADDEIYTLQYVIAKNARPRLRGVHNGARLVWVHSPTDLAVSWQQRAERTQRAAFEMGVNLFVYAGGKTTLRNRLDDRTVPAPKFAASTTVNLARLKYAGNWDPEPAAWARFGRQLHWDTSVAVVPKAVDFSPADSGLSAADFPIAHLTGTAAFAPSEAQLAELRDYVSGGGTLIVEAVGGADSPFADSLQSAILPRAFAGARFEALAADHPMLRATFRGMEDVWPPRLRPYAMKRLGQEVPPIRMASVGKGRVIYLPLDATSGLLGTNTWPIFGYESAEAEALMKNVVLWVMENAPR
jgi:hypothetical protein